jgi:hypothetical protein
MTLFQQHHSGGYADRPFPKPYTPRQVRAILAKRRDSAARVGQQGGHPALLIDTRRIPPILYSNGHTESSDTQGDYAAFASDGIILVDRTFRLDAPLSEETLGSLDVAVAETLAKSAYALVVLNADGAPDRPGFAAELERAVAHAREQAYGKAVVGVSVSARTERDWDACRAVAPAVKAATGKPILFIVHADGIPPSVSLAGGFDAVSLPPSEVSLALDSAVCPDALWLLRLGVPHLPDPAMLAFDLTQWQAEHDRLTDTAIGNGYGLVYRDQGRAFHHHGIHREIVKVRSRFKVALGIR